MEKWGIQKPLELVDRVFSAVDPRDVAASASLVASCAAKSGDRVALQIYENAGHEMSAQVLAVIKNNDGKWRGPIVASGGAWKGSQRMYEVFYQDIKAQYPDAVILRPLFDPVVGCIVLRYFQKGMKFEDFKDSFAENFYEFMIEN